VIIDIRYTDKGPEQIQHIRRASLYPQTEASHSPELVIHYEFNHRNENNGMEMGWIPLDNVRSISFTND